MELGSVTVRTCPATGIASDVPSTVTVDGLMTQRVGFG
jgi:hypothetical protein